MIPPCYLVNFISFEQAGGHVPTIWPVRLDVFRLTCLDTLTSVVVLIPVKVTPESTMAVPLVANTQTHLVTGRIFKHKDVIIIVNKRKVLLVISLRVSVYFNCINNSRFQSKSVYRIS